MSEASDNSRNNDTKSLKDNILKYVTEDLNEEERVLLDNAKHKRNRGFKNPVLASFLIPAQLVAPFNDDPEGCVFI